MRPKARRAAVAGGCEGRPASRLHHFFGVWSDLPVPKEATLMRDKPKEPVVLPDVATNAHPVADAEPEIDRTDAAKDQATHEERGGDANSRDRHG